MRGRVGKLFVAVLLTMCVGVQVLEASGRWDRRVQDANDEAGLVAVVLCVGMAILTAGALLTGIRPSRVLSRPVPVPLARLLHPAAFVALTICCDSPPLPLRI